MKTVAGNIKRLLNALCTLLLIVTTMFAAGAVLGGCDVHEFPHDPEPVIYKVKLEFETGIVQKDYLYTKADGYDMRYTLKAFPVVEIQGNTIVERESAWEYAFSSSVYNGNYSIEKDIEMDLPDGEYVFHVWADFVKAGTNSHHFYNPDNMEEISLYGEHKGGTDMKDAFRGTLNFKAVTDTTDQGRILVVKMDRPLAKFEFRATDLEAFIEREFTKTKHPGALTEAIADSIITRAIQTNTIRFSYKGYMPSSYDIFTDILSGAKTGASFETKLTKLENGEISMGFDYVFSSREESSVSMVMAMYDGDGNEVFETNPIEVLVKRGQHSIVRGPFLTIDTRGGVGIDPGFEGTLDYEVKY